MKRILVWDLPTRLFHALLASAFFGSFVIANVVDDDSPAFTLHMLLGGIMAFMIVLRVIWGVVGSRWARFGSFMFGPRAVLAYAKGILNGSGERHVGHNPGSSWAIFAMLTLTLGSVITGVQMSTGGELVEELHEIAAYALLGVVCLHVAGVLLHTLRLRENIVLSMIDGHKQGEPEHAISSAHGLIALVFVGLTVAWTYGLVASHDAKTNRVTLPILGTTIQLGEAED